MSKIGLADKLLCVLYKLTSLKTHKFLRCMRIYHCFSRYVRGASWLLFILLETKRDGKQQDSDDLHYVWYKKGTLPRLDGSRHLILCRHLVTVVCSRIP